MLKLIYRSLRERKARFTGTKIKRQIWLI